MNKYSQLILSLCLSLLIYSCSSGAGGGETSTGNSSGGGTNITSISCYITNQNATFC